MINFLTLLQLWMNLNKSAVLWVFKMASDAGENEK
jgi:hypothetical protein